MSGGGGSRRGLPRFIPGILRTLYPKAFWRENGEEILRFLELQREEGRYGGWVGGVRYRLEVARDAMRAGMRLRISGVSPPPNAGPGTSIDSGRDRASTLDTVVQDFRFAARSLGKRPGFTAMIVLTLGLGIGATTTIFTLVHGVVLTPLPFDEPEALVIMHETLPEQGSVFAVSYPNFLDWQAQAAAFEGMFAYNSTQMSLTDGGDPAQLDATAVSASLFDVLRVHPFLGRGFSAEEDQQGGTRVTLLSHRLWQERFGGDPGIIGRTITLDGLDYAVVGVMPRTFTFPLPRHRYDVLLPIGRIEAPWIGNRGSHPGIAVIGRLADGVGIERARADMDGVGARLEDAYPETNAGIRTRVRALHEQAVGRVDGILWILFLGVGVVLLIACTNVANLLLADGASRQREVAVRAALGAPRGRVVRFLLTESVLLWLVGAGVGIGLAQVGSGLLSAWLVGVLPRVEGVGLNGSVLSFALGISLITGVVFALLPAMRTARTDLQSSLREGGRTNTGSGGHRTRRRLVVAEIALAQALLVVAGLSLHSLLLLTRADPGLDAENVLTVRVSLPGARYPEPGERHRFFNELRDRVEALPGVVSASVTGQLPLGPGGWQNGYTVEGEEAPVSWQSQLVEVFVVTPEYHATMGIPLLRGRLFDERDGRDSTRVALVDETFAERHWSGTDPVGKRFTWGNPGPDADWFEVVGVVGNVKDRGVATETRVQMYIPFEHDDDDTAFLAARSVVPTDALVEPIRRAVLDLDPQQPISAVQTMEGYLQMTTRSDRILGLLLAMFAALAVVLASVGIYGVVSRAITERTHEIGVRMAVGASRGRVLGMVVRQGLTWTLVGVASGLVLALVVAALMTVELYGVAPLDPLALSSASVFLGLVALAASYLPAWRASRVDPLVALRTE